MDALAKVRATTRGLERAHEAWLESIRAAVDDGERRADVAEAAGVSRSMVYKIVTGYVSRNV